MERQPVVSGHIASVGYDGELSVLEVAFRDGAVYRYFAVPRSVHRAFMRAASKGRFLTAVVKPTYSYERVAD
ncbi:KTSC domain-containing protein [Yinghuangia soli]|uniref:KTSC domain-containing protein n=1 Tax=Yinghuangia soli TaxID=2908204 RepID=A0AA41Q4D4_9ACTN|nr:KTSC domain-containing protein [Yinghuangia soli]MCF2531333.1 KTSC domain-containing protein [Yinghuangia soli]